MVTGTHTQADTNNQIIPYTFTYVIVQGTTMTHERNTGVYILLHGVVIANNSKISTKDIGETDDGALLCFTDLDPPYKNVSDMFEDGNWYFPNNSVVGTSGDVYTTRGYGVVRLHRRTNVTMASGWFHCEILDTSRNNQSIFVEISNNVIDTTVISNPVEVAIAGASVGGLILISAGFVLVILMINRYKYL